MNKRDALRLKPGDEISFCDHHHTAQASQWWTGEVLHVTSKGGIKVRVTEGRADGWRGPGTGPDVGTERWVPYHHVVGKH